MRLGLGQVVFVDDMEYVVRGMIAFREDSWEWEEYKLVADNGWCQWLSVEMEDGRPVYSFYRDRFDVPQNPGMQVSVDGETYEMEERGKATVTDYFGQVDVDKWESFTYTEYANAEKNRFVSYENWDGEIEKSTGVLLTEEQVRITDEKKQVVSSGGSGSRNGFLSGGGYGYSSGDYGYSAAGNRGSGSIDGKKFAVVMIIAVCLVAALSDAFTAIGGLKTNHIQSYLETSGYFTYVTSVTNSENNKKAKVYKTDLTIEEAVKKIIDNVPEQIDTVSQVEKQEGEEGDDSVGLGTSKEYAFVYLSEEGTTYVQVSNKNYVTQNSDAYRSRYGRRHRYSRTYFLGSYGNTNSSYTSYLNSARQSSVNSRRSSGGGTSYGK